MANPEAEAFRSALAVIEAAEPHIATAIAAELDNQRRQLKLIASENYASPAVLLAMGNWLSDKYAEGTPGHRFYAGCEVVGEIERIGVEHAKAVFGAEHAYVQPHSGIDANLVAFWAILAARVEQPRLDALGVKHVNDLDDATWEVLRRELVGQRLLGMSLDAGGHLTHGFRPNISGKLFDQRSYGVDVESGLIDYAAVRKVALEFRPLILVAGYSAYPRNPNFAILREIADEVGATFMVDMAHFAGLVAGGVLTGDLDPVPHARRHVHNAQIPTRPSRRLRVVHRRVRRVRGSRVPDGARRSAPERHRGQGRRLRRSATAGVLDLRATDSRQRQGARRGAHASRGSARN
jgi:glycine hydroxymethyltransferase